MKNLILLDSIESQIQERILRLQTQNPEINPSEGLVEIQSSHKILVQPYYYAMGLKSASNKILLRQSVVERLEEAAQNLEDDLCLLIFDGWRPLRLQQELYDYYYKKTKDNPLISVSDFVFNPLDTGKNNRDYPTDFPPHRTGGAVDLALIHNNGDIIDFGTEFDALSELAKTNAFESINQNDKQPTLKIMETRRYLCQIMFDAGFSNYPGEWWHFDYGNTFWKFYNKLPQNKQVFGAIDYRAK